MQRMMIRRALLTAWLLASCPVPSLPALASGPTDFADLAEKLSPAVVNIATQAGVRVSAVDDMLQGRNVPPEMREALRQFFGERLPEGGVRTRQVSSLGSGFIIDASGLVMTNGHVVDGADEITVILSDGKRLKAKLLGRDRKTDLALLRVESDRPLPALKFGDSDRTRVGEPVLAIGNPFGLGGSVTAGIVSARNRNINAGPFDDFIQTDAAINRGNSGGPLFNTAGDVIGVNTAILSPSGGSVGIGFAIPANTARAVAQQLEKRGYVERGRLGVRIQPITAEIAESLGLDKPLGAIIAAVDPGSPAAAAGLRKGDAVLAFNDAPITDARLLQRLTAAAPINEPVRLRVLREGREQTFNVRIGKSADEETPGDHGKLSAESATDSGIAGISLRPMTPALRATLEIPEEITGAVIAAVKPDTPAADAGLAAGDVIVEIQQKPVESVADAVRVIKTLLGRRNVLLSVFRGGNLSYIGLPLK